MKTLLLASLAILSAPLLWATNVTQTRATVYDEGTFIVRPASFNFVGSGVTVTKDGNGALVTITGGGAGSAGGGSIVMKQGSSLVNVSTIVCSDNLDCKVDGSTANMRVDLSSYPALASTNSWSGGNTLRSSTTFNSTATFNGTAQFYGNVTISTSLNIFTLDDTNPIVSLQNSNVSGHGILELGSNTSSDGAILRMMASGAIGSRMIMRQSGLVPGLVLEVKGREALNIENSGNVGINTANPAALLHVASAAGTTGALLVITTGTTSNPLFEVWGGSIVYRVPLYDAFGNINSTGGASGGSAGGEDGFNLFSSTGQLIIESWNLYKSSGELATKGWNLFQSTGPLAIQGWVLNKSTGELSDGGWNLFQATGPLSIQGWILNKSSGEISDRGWDLYKATGALLLGAIQSTITNMATTNNVINQSSNPVSWTALKDVPAGFSDGSDDGSGGGTTVLPLPQGATNYIQNSTNTSSTYASNDGFRVATAAATTWIGLAATSPTFTSTMCFSLYTAGSTTTLCGGLAGPRSAAFFNGAELVSTNSFSGAGDNTKFLRGDGTWNVPASAAGDAVLAGTQTFSGQNTFVGNTVIFTTDPYICTLKQVAFSTMVVSTPGTSGYGLPVIQTLDSTGTWVSYFILLGSGAQTNDPQIFITIESTGRQVNPILGAVAIGTTAANGSDQSKVIWGSTTAFSASSATVGIEGQLFNTSTIEFDGAGPQSGNSRLIYVKIWLWTNGRSSQAIIYPPVVSWRRRT